MSSKKMVAPKIAALSLSEDLRQEVRTGLSESYKLSGDKSKIVRLLEIYNDLAGFEQFTISDYSSCGDCRISLNNFWKNIVILWGKEKV